LLWTALATLPLAAAVQEICDRTALATGRELGELAARRFRRGRAVVGFLVVALLVANLLNITADIVAVGEGMALIIGPASIWALVAGFSVTMLVVAGSFDMVAVVLKTLCASLLGYVGVMLVVQADWASVVSHTFFPHVEVTSAYLSLLLAVLGTTLSPYLFFWQSAHRVEELRAEPEGGDRAVPIGRLGRRRAKEKERTSRVDVFVGFGFSNLVMFAIMVSTAATIGGRRNVTITSAAEAARALRPVAGRFAELLFAVGFIGSGMLAIPVLAGSGSAAMAGLLGKEWGYSERTRHAPVFYGLVIAGMLGGTVLTLVDVNPVELLVYVAMINGVIAAPLLAVVMLIADDRRLMNGRENGRLARVLGWGTVALMALVAAGALFTM
jgi:Mn2+/Fe2+ NRAMP family transporter